jgi:hypothetical protein
VARDGIPYRWLGWLALPEERRRAQGPIATSDELARFDLESDRIVLGSPEEPSARFEPSPLLVALLRELGQELGPEGLRRR